MRFEDPQQQVTAERAEFNLFTRSAPSINPAGSFKGKESYAPQGANPQPVTFYLVAERFVRESEERFRISRGSLTSCVGPNPGWQFKTRDSTVEVEGYAHLSACHFLDQECPGLLHAIFCLSNQDGPCHRSATARLRHQRKLWDSSWITASSGRSMTNPIAPSAWIIGANVAFVQAWNIAIS